MTNYGHPILIISLKQAKPSTVAQANKCYYFSLQYIQNHGIVYYGYYVVIEFETGALKLKSITFVMDILISPHHPSNFNVQKSNCIPPFCTGFMYQINF